MEFNIEETGALSYCLKVEVSAEELEPDINRAVRKHRAQLQMKGFRKGRVPVELVRRLHGKELAQEAVQSLLEEMFTDLVLDSGKYNVWKDSPLYNFNYEYEKGVTARIIFAERPTIELQDLEGQELAMPADRLTEEHVDRALEDILWNYGSLQPAEEGAEIREGDVLTYDLQEIDPELRAPILGTARKDQELILSEEEDALEEELREVVLGAQVGTVVRFEVESDETGAVQDLVRRRTYEAAITAVRRWRAAEVTDELARRLTGGGEHSADTFREWVTQITDVKLRRRNAEIRQTRMVDRLLDMHEFEAPQLAIDMFVDSASRREAAWCAVNASAEGSFEALRERLGRLAERQARWLFLRNALLEKYEIELSEMDVRLDMMERARAELVNGLYMNQAPDDFVEPDRMDPRSAAYRARDRKLFEKLAEVFKITVDDPAAPEEAEPELLEA